MSTIYTFHSECPALAEAPAGNDRVLIYDTSAGRTKYVEPSYLAGAPAAIVAVTAATLAVTPASHAGRTVTLAKVDGLAVTLPAATGSGNKYRFWIKLATTSVGYSIATAPTTDIFAGVIYGEDGDGEPANSWPSASDSNKITLGGTSLATGGAIGDWIEVEDVTAGVWAVKGSLTQGGTEATPFSHV